MASIMRDIYIYIKLKVHKLEVINKLSNTRIVLQVHVKNDMAG